MDWGSDYVKIIVWLINFELPGVDRYTVGRCARPRQTKRESKIGVQMVSIGNESSVLHLSTATKGILHQKNAPPKRPLKLRVVNSVRLFDMGKEEGRTQRDSPDKKGLFRLDY